MEVFELIVLWYCVWCVLEVFYAFVYVGGWYVKFDRGVF